MKDFGNLIIGLFVVVAIAIGISFFIGRANVQYTETIGKAQQNAERTVYEESQSYVEAKRQTANKYYLEYQKASKDEKQALKAVIVQEFANFDENKLNEPFRTFIRECKTQ